MPSDSNRPHSGLKQRWLRILQTGAGSLVVAAAIVSAPPAKAAQVDARASVAERVEQAKEWMRQDPPALDVVSQTPEEFGWIRWGNLLHPMWNNWPNWHNWHNWPNWPNY
ncbi:MAG TPA: hypothetical protein VKM54_16870 [Myxococcota bacterium]|nr:hypothetical protein [Myxococcota bacterium]